MKKLHKGLHYKRFIHNRENFGDCHSTQEILKMKVKQVKRRFSFISDCKETNEKHETSSLSTRQFL